MNTRCSYHYILCVRVEPHFTAPSVTGTSDARATGDSPATASSRDAGVRTAGNEHAERYNEG